jgi:hypothetical protein
VSTLVFTSSCTRKEQFNLFATSQAKARCSADSALIDVRTGTIPFLARASHDLVLDEVDSDLQLRDTARRAELRAIDLAMQENARAFGTFLRQATKRAPAP